MEELPYWLKVLSALSTPAIAVLGIAIAWGQWATARSKLILDLYEHRRKIYDAFDDQIQVIMTGVPSQDWWESEVALSPA
jgi:hypothetical protein